MLTREKLTDLLYKHGAVTHYVITEGGEWFARAFPLVVSDLVEMKISSSAQHMHALRFADGTEWDEVNGIRRKETAFWFEIQEYKIWKGIRTDRPIWSGINLLNNDWQSLNETLEYLQKNKPDGIFRIHMVKVSIAVDSSEQDNKIPEFDESIRCPEHPEEEVNISYGLAGGGIGPYTLCSECGRVLSKSQDKE